MSVEALYSVEFVSNQRIVGTGVAVLETQRILGGDSQYTYVGEYKVENGAFSASSLSDLGRNFSWAWRSDRSGFR